MHAICKTEKCKSKTPVHKIPSNFSMFWLNAVKMFEVDIRVTLLSLERNNVYRVWLAECDQRQQGAPRQASTKLAICLSATSSSTRGLRSRAFLLPLSTDWGEEDGKMGRWSDWGREAFANTSTRESPSFFPVFLRL